MEKNNKKTKTPEKPEPKKKMTISSYFRVSPIVSEKEVDMKTRTVLLLDSRNDMVPFFFGGLDVMASNYTSKAVNFYQDFVYMTCKGFMENVRDRSIKFMEKKNPEYGIGDILRNRKKQCRFIVNMLIDSETGELIYVWVDPNDARSPRSSCSANTMRTWIEK